MTEKIAIIGGGIGGLTAAFDLSDQKFETKYDITVYQMGWRLGGKCATGRNQSKNQRIEEHGIHAFAGSYYNALKMMKLTFDELDRPKSHKLSDFESAFVKEYSSFMWDYQNGQMTKWISQFPQINIPGQTREQFNESLKETSTLFHWVRSIAFILPKLISLPRLNNETPASIHINDYVNKIDVLKNSLGDFQLLSDIIPWDLFLPLFENPGRPPAGDDTDRRDLDRIEFLQVILRGVHDDKLDVDGFAKVDNEDFDNWMIRHGASDELMKSTLVTSTMFVTYQFPGGDLSRKPVMSASSFVQWILRGSAYIDAPYYLFEAGSGETLIEPLYTLLKNRGVTFKFFHELSNVELSAKKDDVEQLTFNIQAELQNGDYDPLIDVKGLKAWPNEPLYDQLAEGRKQENIDFEAPNAICRKTLKLNFKQDFDKVILAIPPKALMTSAKNLFYENSPWQKIEKLALTATQSMQIWLNDPIEKLTQHTNSFFVSGNYRSGLHGIAEFKNILKHEDWTEQNAPQGLVYFSGVMTLPNKYGENSVRDLADQKAFQTAETMLASSGIEIFPQSTERSSTAIDFAFDYQALYPVNEKTKGVDRLSDQYIRGNALPSELYTQAPPGTKALRIDPLSPPLKNLTVAGDWVDTRLNVGSVEGAVIGGRLAACFIEPRLKNTPILGIQL